MPKELVIITCILLFGTWLVLNKSSVGEKITIVLSIAFIYIVFSLMSGSTLPEILPFLK